MPASAEVCSEACSAVSSELLWPHRRPPNDLVETPVLERVLHRALSRGGDFAEIFAEDRSSSSIFLDDRKVEELSSGRDRGAGIRVVIGETTGFAHTADLSEAGLSSAAEAAAAVAREGGGGTRQVALSRRSAERPRAWRSARLDPEVGRR